MAEYTMNALALAETIAGFCGESEVAHLMGLGGMSSSRIRDAVEDAAESVAWATVSRGHVHADVDELRNVDVERVMDAWRGDYAPHWIIYTSDCEAVVSEVGISEALEYAHSVTGEPVSDVASLAAWAHHDLVGAVESAFICADWDSVADDIVAGMESEWSAERVALTVDAVSRARWAA